MWIQIIHKDPQSVPGSKMFLFNEIRMIYCRIFFKELLTVDLNILLNRTGEPEQL